MLKNQSPEEELEFLKQIHGTENWPALFSELKTAFALLQMRSQMLLGLATICLTITGFSGPRMAQSNALSRFFIGFGLLFVLAAVVAVVLGPLRLKWVTSLKAATMDRTLVLNLERRNIKTRYYKAATALLLIGLTGYLLSLLFYLTAI